MDLLSVVVDEKVSMRQAVNGWMDIHEYCQEK